MGSPFNEKPGLEEFCHCQYAALVTDLPLSHFIFHLAVSITVKEFIVLDCAGHPAFGEIVQKHVRGCMENKMNCVVFIQSCIRPVCLGSVVDCCLFLPLRRDVFISFNMRPVLRLLLSLYFVFLT